MPIIWVKYYAPSGLLVEKYAHPSTPLTSKEHEYLIAGLRRQLLQQRLRLPQIERVEPFSELAPRDWLWPRSLIVPTAITGPVSAVA